jgi:hypothetical protein
MGQTDESTEVLTAHSNNSAVAEDSIDSRHRIKLHETEEVSKTLGYMEQFAKDLTEVKKQQSTK